ncbi:Aspirochlorine biosynthesis protein N [Colletotrichum orbiculare MAFF 240422]|uniref:Aspirochlorine biosynthesis protein N n=1 Tax=Colletotrichum orbiculare (strain 104-T / ATCC 96160 / CBS 514.97 / LARS 414 / MAFF 240422) TaxID=1213857 RepID=N4VH17_COLOR|nr:Aspirochlorine biosynthesis protein N [Colletotrichum orbiculare MAFF 240422]
MALTGRMHFLARDAKYLHEKPYTLRYAPDPEDGIPQSNIDRVEHKLCFHDLRQEHLDYEGSRRIIQETYGEDADSALNGRWQCVNVWHPLRGPLVDWPLALCDAATVDFANDTMPGDVVDRDRVFENTQVHYSARQKWYHLLGQMPTELIVFKNADSQELGWGAAPGVPHASFDNPLKTSTDFLRESIEMRVILRWHDV